MAISEVLRTKIRAGDYDFFYSRIGELFEQKKEASSTLLELQIIQTLAILGLAERVSKIDEKLGQALSKLESYEIRMFMDYIKTIDSNLSSIEEDFSRAAMDINDIANSAEKIADNVNNIEAAVDTVKENVSSIESSMSSITGSLDSIAANTFLLGE